MWKYVDPYLFKDTKSRMKKEKFLNKISVLLNKQIYSLSMPLVYAFSPSYFGILFEYEFFFIKFIEYVLIRSEEYRIE